MFSPQRGAALLAVVLRGRLHRAWKVKSPTGGLLSLWLPAGSAGDPGASLPRRVPSCPQRPALPMCPALRCAMGSPAQGLLGSSWPSGTVGGAPGPGPPTSLSRPPGPPGAPQPGPRGAFCRRPGHRQTFPGGQGPRGIRAPIKAPPFLFKLSPSRRRFPSDWLRRAPLSSLAKRLCSADWLGLWEALGGLPTAVAPKPGPLSWPTPWALEGGAPGSQRLRGAVGPATSREVAGGPAAVDGGRDSRYLPSGSGLVKGRFRVLCTSAWWVPRQ